MDVQNRQPRPARPHLSEADRRRRRRQFRRRRAVAALVGMVVVALAVTALSTGGAGSGAVDRSRSAPSTTVAPSTTSTTVPTSTTTVPPSTTTTTGPGSLPQTGAFPTTTSASFTAVTAALWNGIVTDNVQAAMPAFFPEAAYVQVKAIPDPQADFTDRLVAQFGLDIAAAHALLGPTPSAARLVGVEADASFAHWVPPGVCSNGVGYFELPNTRMVYSLDGQTASFGIASMISWRGEWYVVHLGAVLQGGTGVVDDPQSGPGVPQYSSTC
jgi:hypothetical protein